MIKRILFILLVGLIIAGVGILIMREPGFAVFSYSDTTVEIPLIKFYFGTVAAFIILYFLFRIIGALFRWPKRIHLKRQQKRNLEIMHALESSMLNFSQFNWAEAMRTATKNIKQSPIQKAQHLFTAHCAHNSGQKDTRDAHVTSLRKSESGKSLANTIEAEFCLEDGKHEKALMLLRDESTDNICNLNTLCHSYIKTNDISGLETSLPKLLPHADKAARIQYTVNRSLEWAINYYDVHSSEIQLSDLWKTYHKQLQANPVLLRSYVRTLINHGQDTAAEQIIKTQLNIKWDEALIQEYGLLKIDNLPQRTKQSEDWLQQHKDSAGLLLTLGRLNKNQKLWGKAKSYLESSLSRKPLVGTYAELAELHELLDEPIDAQRCAKKGLHIASR
ncbi:MAG: heme biosynthesis HemY N-terminal domain-containing protein [Gammaproteobacteria bacterium]|nr:heme biosynthesis HemY N-terminal domain-containing protein [Gammaproteobacteria bacterium]